MCGVVLLCSPLIGAVLACTTGASLHTGQALAVRRLSTCGDWPCKHAILRFVLHAPRPLACGSKKLVWVLSGHRHRHDQHVEFCSDEPLCAAAECRYERPACGDMQAGSVWRVSTHLQRSAWDHTIGARVQRIAGRCVLAVPDGAGRRAARIRPGCAKRVWLVSAIWRDGSFDASTRARRAQGVGAQHAQCGNFWTAKCVWDSAE